jgi:hypothetical protein
MALQHIEELRQFIDGRASNETADRGDARIFTAGLADLVVVVQAHRAELPDLDNLAVPAVALLLEDDRAGGRRVKSLAVYWHAVTVDPRCTPSNNTSLAIRHMSVN